ncbi:hypothetical protein GR140_30740 (plasmid) [Pseudomonas putida]|uniref:hypothetical protein n=1 Tax=Pseudomonas putida TaxID=303 RepID=UPI001BB0CD61|nr:hypothetical protein [Pseudomonas putida]QUG93143.1 hypothetical protein GR140_30740 [Pseudomonas putida]
MIENPLAAPDSPDDFVVRDGVLMTVREAKDAAEEMFRRGQELAVHGTPLPQLDATSDAFADAQAGYEAPFKQADWEVELAGNGQDLYDLTGRGGSSDYFRIWGGIDHQNDCPSNDYSFNSLYFDGQRDPEVIWQLAYELVNIFNGASELFSFQAKKQSVREIYFQGKRVSRRQQARVIELLGRPRMHQHKWEEQLGKAMQMSPRLALLVLATENEDIYMMLKYLGFEASWSNYYKLLETMETHAKLKEKEIPGSKAERGRFTNNANNFSLVGYDARHGLKALSDRPNTETAMSLQEAHAFITGRCKGYLNTVYPEYFKFP